jgi:hypothetical protein
VAAGLTQGWQVPHRVMADRTFVSAQRSSSGSESEQALMHGPVQVLPRVGVPVIVRQSAHAGVGRVQQALDAEHVALDVGGQPGCIALVIIAEQFDTHWSPGCWVAADPMRSLPSGTIVPGQAETVAS